MKEFYTCSKSTNPSALLRVGAIAHPLSYSYEVRTPQIISAAAIDGDETASASASDDENVNEAVNRVQHALLQSVASRSGLDDCVILPSVATQARGGWRRRRTMELLRHEIDDNSRMRRLLPKERGSTSIVGVGLLPGDVIDEDAECSSNDISSASTSNSFWSPDDEDTEQPTSGIVEDETNTSSLPNPSDITDIVDVRTDGKIGLLRSNHNILTQEDNSPAGDVVNYSNDHPAFNFISTQSKSLSRNSHTRSHDPLVPLTTRDDFMDTTATPRITTRCTVIKGYMTLYTYDNDEYENIEVRTMHAIQHDMEDGNFVKEHVLNDVVLGVKFIGSNITDDASSLSTKDSISSSPGFVTSIIGSPAAAQSGTTGSEMLDMFTFPVMILIALGTMLIVLIALFVGTSKTAIRKRKRRDNDSPQYDDENDLFLQEVKPADAYEGDGSTINTSYGEEYEAEDYFHKLTRTITGFANQDGNNGLDDDDDDESSVFETYETTVKGNDGVCIRGIRSYADDDYEDCFSISSVHADPHPRPSRLPLPSPGRIFASTRSRDAIDDNRQSVSRNNIDRHNGILPIPGRISRKATLHPTTNAPRVLASTSRDVIEIEASGLSSCDSLRSIPGKVNNTPRRSYPTPSSVMASRSPKRSRQQTRKDCASQKNDPLDVVDGIEVTLVEI